jgi:hypothetical protein
MQRPFVRNQRHCIRNFVLRTLIKTNTENRMHPVSETETHSKHKFLRNIIQQQQKIIMNNVQGIFDSHVCIQNKDQHFSRDVSYEHLAIYFYSSNVFVQGIK